MRRPRRARPLLAAPALLLAWALPVAPPKDPPALREAALAPHWRVVRPEGPGPHPAALLLSGCDGPRDNLEAWARALAAEGRAALILDSHAPRGLDRGEAWRAVCAGARLRGSERAGDLAVALDALARMPGVDGADVVVLGASHGGWAAMEFVRLAAEAGPPPPGLDRWPAPPGALLGRVSALLLLYPYCGALNGAEAEDWAAAPPTLMLLAGADRVVSPAACEARAAAFRAGGRGVTVAVLPGADHGFDQAERSPLSPLDFDAALREAAIARARAFLRGPDARPGPGPGPRLGPG